LKRLKPKAPPKPRNVAAKALSEGQFQPKVEADPKAYNRRVKHRTELSEIPVEDDEDIK
jgi:hypothetical protein